MRANANKLNFYVSDAVRKKLEKLSKDSGLTMTAVITKLILECEIHPLKTDELLKIYNELNHIGNNINQIAHTANALVCGFAPKTPVLKGEKNNESKYK